ncbi:AAA-domain-containing protein [Daldinia caldariorum]|uniref:AAA-domain-containing protein n=1 Tax=Daldinia caldariorum TaxID=326644 RepID=UPI002007A535|nr:AAA-domain-containing protein [Daldinia caldariorum]KAI1471641.1 AAA-domain-containing protein [Daldinia caldariorum]
MHTRSLRAFRSAALSLQKPPLATYPTRLFHSSAPVNAAGNGNGNGNTGPRDDGNKPEKESGAGDNDNGDENLFGENLSAAEGKTQGRKKPSNSSLKSRILRNRKPEELPPVHVPKSFLSKAISRPSDTETHFSPSRISERDAHIMLEEALFHPQNESVVDEHLAYLVEATAWSDETIAEARQILGSNLDADFIQRKGNILVAAAFWAAVISTRDAHGEKAAEQLHEKAPVSNSGDLLTALTYGILSSSGKGLPQLSNAKQIIANALNDSPLEASTVSWFEQDLIEDIVASINADLRIQVPHNVKVADLRRPITILNTPESSGYFIPHDVLCHVATKLEADVLHLKASDIAYIVGRYLGQDAARTPGAISQLGYKAAENNGRLKLISQPEDPTRRKDPKNYLLLMDEYLNTNTTNRGKDDDLWRDLKINTVLDEILHCADSESPEQRPLIVHINDFNAINMDTACGTMIISKLRKAIDGLWADGRKIVLVGSCSTKEAPKAYLSALRELESSERVITLRLAMEEYVARGALTRGRISEISSAMAKRVMFNTKCQYLEARDFIRENEENLVRILSSMVEPPSESPMATTGEMKLSQIDYRKLPDSWTKEVLPLNEVYRIATMMIGYSKDPSDIFKAESPEHVIDIIERRQRLKDQGAKMMTAEERNQRLDSRDSLDTRKLVPTEDDQEERIESGLINAQDIRTTFKDIHAPKETIESVKMLTTLSLIRPEAFSYGVLATDRIPGCLLYGPPGTGKTLLAKAVAKESGANMIEISGASINNKYVGESEKNVRALFRLAKKKEPLVIFIDEGDALLGTRGRRDQGSRRETINQFLREWDGMDKTKAFIMVATNRPFDLDEAVLRRLPRKLLIDLPLEADRAAILRIHLKDEVLDEKSVSIEDLAKRTPLYSGSDLKNVCVAAAMAAVKEELELEQKQQQQQQQEQQEQQEQGQEQKQAGKSNEYEGRKRRVLAARHFDKALQEIGASVSEDMTTLTAIRKFDEKYGDGGAAQRRRRKGIGFGVTPEAVDAQEARVRSGK